MNNWKLFFALKTNKKMFFIGLILLIITLIIFSIFLKNYVELRNGITLNDFLLDKIPSINFSTYIFLLIWASAAFTFDYFYKNPSKFLIFIWSYTFLCLSRIITIGLVPLNPPKNLITLADPIANLFYGGKFLTKDLFYSGHTATVFLMYLVVETKILKYFLLINSILIGIMVLVQHVHYTIDVAFAPIFAVIVFTIGKKISNQP